MDDITVKVADLAEKVKANRNKHQEEFREVDAAFRTELREQLEQRLRDRNGGPRDHTADYDGILELLAMHAGNTITLSEYDIERYVNDRWNWRNDWDNTKRLYKVQ